MKSDSAKDIRISAPAINDVPALMDLVAGMAASIGASQNFINSSENLSNALFSEPPLIEAIIARYREEPVGFAAWNSDYRLFSGRRSMVLEYIYVKPDFRGKPITLAMLLYLLGLAKRRDYIAIQGVVLDENRGALSLYSGLKVQELDQRTFRLDLREVDWDLMQRFLPEGAGLEPVT